jgi:hypothetical protein
MGIGGNLSFLLFYVMLGKITIKGAKGAKIKVFFQGLQMTHIIYVSVYNSKFCISNTPFNTAF